MPNRRKPRGPAALGGEGGMPPSSGSPGVGPGEPAGDGGGADEAIERIIEGAVGRIEERLTDGGFFSRLVAAAKEASLAELEAVALQRQQEFLQQIQAMAAAERPPANGSAPGASLNGAGGHVPPSEINERAAVQAKASSAPLTVDDAFKRAFADFLTAATQYIKSPIETWQMVGEARKVWRDSGDSAKHPLEVFLKAASELDGVMPGFQGYWAGQFFPDQMREQAKTSAAAFEQGFTGRLTGERLVRQAIDREAKSTAQERTGREAGGWPARHPGGGGNTGTPTGPGSSSSTPPIVDNSSNSGGRPQRGDSPVAVGMPRQQRAQRRLSDFA